MALNSNSTIKILDLLCEGEIDGIVGNREGVFINETALQAGNNVNIRNDEVSYTFRPGTRDQSQTPNIGRQVQNLINVSQEVGQNYSETLNSSNEVTLRNYGAGSVVRSVTDPDTETIDLIFTIPRLFSTAAEGLARGQLFDATIFFDVGIKPSGRSSFDRLRVNDAEATIEQNNANGQFRIQGISTSPYQYAITGIRLSDFGPGPWDIRVRKYPEPEYQGDRRQRDGNALDTQTRNTDRQIFEVTYGDFEDADFNTPLASGRGNQLIWASIIERQSFRSGYPYCAVVGMNISTEYAQSLPTRAYKIRGKKVQIPNNATPESDGRLSFNGDFDGTLKSGLYYTTCPVCIFYDLLTNKRYGAGHFVQASNLSWVDLYSLSKYCNELIDGKPRFACNVVVSSQQEAFNVLQDFASIFRGMIYWNTNVIQLAADHGNLGGSTATDVDPVHVFSNSNVVGGAFNYSGSSLKTRSTSIRIRYNDPDSFYRPNVVCIEDAQLIEKYGYQVKEVTAFGCTSKEQARRVGRWMMKSEELNQNTITFSVGLEGVLVLPGQVFAVADEMRAGTRLSGRVSSSTTTSIVADQAITLPSGTNPKLTCVLASGAVETKDISSDPAGSTTVNVSSAFSAAPLQGTVYSITTDSASNQKFRCLTVTDGGDGTYGIIGVSFNDSIYNAVDQDDDLEFTDVTTLDEAPPIPVI